MKYKLLGLEQLAVIKERYFVQGLRERLKLFANILGVKGKAVDMSDVIITLTRNLPENEVTIQELVTLRDFASDETLLSQIPFIEEPTEEIKRVKVQLEEKLKRTQREFGYPIDPPEDVTGDEDEE